MKKNKLTFILTGVLLFAFLVFTALVKFVDVRQIGPLGSSVGLAFLNEPFMMKMNETFDKASDIILLMSFLLLLVCAGIGLVQLINKRHLLKVDSKVLAIPATLILTLLFIVFFEFVVINQRPVLIEGELEASYPSTHTTLIFTTLLITIPVLNSFTKKNYEKYGIFALYLVLAVCAIIFRVLSGVHYFTDIIGGLLLALSMGAANKSFEILFDKFHKE